MATISTENTLVMNQGKSPLVGYNFMLRVEGIYDLPCKSIRAFSRELEFDYVQEGGLNDYVHMLRKPITRPFTLEVERYVGVDYVDPLPEGADLILPIILMVSRTSNQSGYIPFVCARTYVFTGCTVIKKTYGDLVGDRSELLVETTTIAYREFSVINAPWSESALEDIVPEPEVANTQQNALDELKSDVEDLIAKAEAELEKAEAAVGKASALQTDIAASRASIEKVKENSTKQKEAAYSQIDSLTEQNQQAKEELRSLRAALNGLPEGADGETYQTQIEEKEAQIKDLGDQIQENRLLAVELEDMAVRTDNALKEISSAEKLSAGTDGSPNRMTEASDAKEKASTHLAAAKEQQKTLQAAGDLTAGQSAGNKAKSEAEASIRSAGIACKQIAFFEGKLENAQEFLAQYGDLAESDTAENSQEGGTP